MLSSKKYIVLFLLAIILAGYAYTETLKTSYIVKDSSITTQKLLSVELSIYVENSPRAQPELANMYTNLNGQDVLDKFTKWIHSDATTVSIDDSNLNRIFLLQFDYDNKAEEYYLCLQINHQFYIKQIGQVSKLNLDKYDLCQNSYLIDIAGRDGWIETSEIPH